MTTIELGEMAVDVVLKDIKNVHLSVHPPSGRVRIAAPRRTSIDSLRLYAISKLGWIKKEQRKLREQERETPRDYLERESHYVWGKRYLLSVHEADQPPMIEQRHRRLVLTVRPGASKLKRRQIMEDWYRELVKSAAVDLFAKWEPKIGVEVAGFYVRRMKTRWGSCNHNAQTIRLNTDLARKPPECLEYIVVHEMIHILEPTHNDRFQKLMGRYLPDWKHRRQVLNRLPVRHEDWGY
ncbi:M48 family metallopeptidase [Blastopirellula sp. J2-11]|uniref:M48 family metallopeptidase n=1 Tax=Blastopirellula sp. J2-11 TaxID=2943192 RepID=UPI0021C6AE7F|nr:SprT family zinc-dependent metalloprotease [Blastopirellula sp. J2-11]UUO08099.1 M48 family metallopeptidase [Blastopirellula sp. J2-11]